MYGTYETYCHEPLHLHGSLNPIIRYIEVVASMVGDIVARPRLRLRHSAILRVRTLLLQKVYMMQMHPNHGAGGLNSLSPSPQVLKYCVHLVKS